ncbi:putative RNA-directed DNA polymerase [Arabidopsis thaliana]
MSDPSLFIYIKGKDIIMLLLYVDDMAITGNSSDTLATLLNELNKRFRMKDMGQLHYFLGIQAQFHSGGLFLSQQKYAEDLLVVAGMLDCAPMPTPLPLQLNKVSHQEEKFENPTYFRSLAGKLQYLTLTRPDIQFAVNYVRQKMHMPTVADFNLLKRIIRYIKRTVTMGISFNKDTDCTLRAYSDSDYGGCETTSRSTGGFYTFLGNNIISWQSQKQPTVAKSSTEAEYRALSEAASEITWLSIRR